MNLFLLVTDSSRVQHVCILGIVFTKSLFQIFHSHDEQNRSQLKSPMGLAGKIVSL